MIIATVFSTLQLLPSLSCAQQSHNTSSACYSVNQSHHEGPRSCRTPNLLGPDKLSILQLLDTIETSYIH